MGPQQWGAAVHGVLREVLADKVAFERKPKGGEEASHAHIRGTVVQAEGTVGTKARGKALVGWWRESKVAGVAGAVGAG